MRAAGAALIALAFAVPEWLWAAHLQKRWRRDLALASFFEYLSVQISHFSRDQEQVFASFENAFLEKAGFLPLLRQNVREDPVGALERSLNAFWDAEPTNEVYTETLSFARRFGMQSKKAQMEDLNALISLYTLQIKEKKETIAARIRLAVVTGAFCGLGLWILLI